MEFTTQGGKKTIYPLMSSGVENVIRGDDEVVEVGGELEDKMGREVKVPQKVNPMNRSPSPFFKEVSEKDRGW